jgi:hypothetical protein
VVGPQRTGTTWLQEVLDDHVGLSPIKETQFFKWNYRKGLAWYAGHFKNCPDKQPVGEICPVYFGYKASRERIARDLPKIKIICALRDPVERAYSHYRVLRAHAGLGDFEESLEILPDLIESSLYARHLPAWQQALGKQNVLVVLYSDLQRDPQRFMDMICQFIGIGRIDLSQSTAGNRAINRADRTPRSRRLAQAASAIHFWMLSHSMNRTIQGWRKSPLWNLCFGGGKEYGPMKPETERHLRELFLPDVEKLEALLGQDFSSWKPRHFSGAAYDRVESSGTAR